MYKRQLVGRLGVVALVVSLLAMILSCGPPTTGYFANLEFSPDLHLIPSHPLSPEPHVGSFYFVFHTGTGLTEVDHLRQDGPATVSYTHLDVYKRQRCWNL